MASTTHYSRVSSGERRPSSTGERGSPAGPPAQPYRRRMSISERAAAEILRPVGMSREQARRLLLTGAAGSGVRGRTTTYDESAVRALAARPAVDEGRLAAD